jgi:sulfite exporter TauE/SafE
MEFASINTPAAAFAAGLVTSLHCAGMCGPLACVLAPAKGDRADPQTVATVYHTTRLAGYMTLGAVAGAMGAVPLGLLGGGALRVLPWVLVAYFLFVALRPGRRLPRPAFLSRLQGRLMIWIRGRPGLQVAAAMGAATPLLPCGPLYFLVALAALTGSAVRGAELMLAFGLGTVPLLWVVQAGFGRMRARLSPAGMARLQTGLALVSALVITWRLRGAFGLPGPDASGLICTWP